MATEYDLERYDDEGDVTGVIPLLVEASWNPGSPASMHDPGEAEGVELELVIHRTTGAPYPYTDEEQEQIIEGIEDDLRPSDPEDDKADALVGADWWEL